jgi:hypothetical protein
MAIIKVFKEWRHYFSRINYPVIVHIDYKNFTTFTENKVFNKRQIKWIELLSEFNFQIMYYKGSENGKADAFSRKEDLKQNTLPTFQSILKWADDIMVVPAREVNNITFSQDNT